MGSDESHFNVSLIVRDSVHKPQPFWRERRAEADSNRGPSAYQPWPRLTTMPNRLTAILKGSSHLWPILSSSVPLFELEGSLDFIPGAFSLYDLDPGRTRFSALYQRSAWTHKTHTIWERGLITDFLPVLTAHRSNTYHVLTLPTRQGGITLTRNLC